MDNEGIHAGNCTCINCCPELHKCANCEECGAAIYPDFRLCPTCEQALESQAEDEAQRWADEGERSNGYPFGTIGAETR